MYIFLKIVCTAKNVIKERKKERKKERARDREKRKVKKKRFGVVPNQD